MKIKNNGEEINMKLIKLYNSLITEATETNHLFGRLKGRIDTLSDAEITNSKKRFLDKYLDIVKRLNYNPSDSFAIKVIDLEINPESKLYINVRGREYYRINDFLGRDSTGNQIWIIIRNNKLTTAMLRKDIQPVSKLRVDYVVHNIDDLQKLLANNIIK